MDRRSLARLKHLLSSFLCYVLLSSCRHSVPVISFVTIPPAGRGGKVAKAECAGKVAGAKPGQRIVLYAKTDVWWFQSGDKLTYAEIQPDGSWSKTIHLGSQYAAMLVNPAYRPSPTMTELPAVGGDISVVAVVPGKGGRPRGSRTA